MFLDIVRFTKYGDNSELRRAVRTLQNAIVDTFDTDDFHWDDPGINNELIMLPTGDGYGIGFDPSVKDVAILNLAASLSAHLSSEGYPVRIGIAKGPCFVYKDLNYRLNLTGWGIIDAERAMSCGDANHILCTDMFAKPLLDSSSKLSLYDIGAFEKKGRPLVLYNYYSRSFGNSKHPSVATQLNSDKHPPTHAKRGGSR